MLTITLLKGIISILLSVLAGFFVGQYWNKRKNGDWQSQYKELEASHKELSKISKKDKKQLERLNQQAQSTQTKYNTLNTEHGSLSKKVDELQLALNEKNTAYDSLKSKSEADLRSMTNRFERLDKEHAKLKERYATDLKDSKGWKNTRERLTRTSDDYKFKWEKGEKEKAKLQEKLNEQAEKIDEAAETRREFRRLRGAKGKLEKDIEYWEKKHYDTHHELAEAQDRIEALVEGLEELDQLKKGELIKQQNMMKKIEEYKTKFVDINHKYQALVGQQ